jgi:hypothetical protein
MQSVCQGRKSAKSLGAGSGKGGKIDWNFDTFLDSAMKSAVEILGGGQRLDSRPG